jgi:hypothetical protein
MLGASTAAAVRKYLLPKSVAGDPPRPEFTIESAGAILNASQLEAMESELRAATEAAEVALTAAKEAYAAECERINELRLQFKLRTDDVRRATSFAIAQSQPSSEEIVLESQHKDALLKVGQLQGRYGIYSATMSPPEQTTDCQKLASIEVEISECEDRIRNEHAVVGTSRSDHRLRHLLGERQALQPGVDSYRTRFAKWQEIQVAKQFAAELGVKCEQLKQARHDAAIAAAIEAAR